MVLLALWIAPMSFSEIQNKAKIQKAKFLSYEGFSILYTNHSF